MTSTDRRANQHLLLAIIFISLAALSYTIASIFVKFASAHVTTSFILFIRYAFFMLCLIPLGLRRIDKLKTPNLKQHIIRGCCGLLSIGCFFFAIRYVPLTQAILLSMSTPLFVPIVLRMLRGIRIIPQLYWGMVIGLIGIILILHPGVNSFHIALLIALASAIFRALSVTYVRQISKTDSSFAILFYYFLIGTIVSAVSLLFFPQHFNHAPWLYLLVIGVTSALYQVFLTSAFRLAPVRLVSPFTYLSVVFGAIADWLLWNEGLSMIAIVGIALVFMGAVLTVYLGNRSIQKNSQS